MAKFFLSNFKLFAGALIGTGLGYAYWYFVGCESGTCPITANWGSSTAYGALMGASLMGLFDKEKKSRTE
jgi:hypothetical protein